MRLSPTVRAANKASSSQLYESISSIDDSVKYRLKIVRADDLLQAMRDNIWLVFYANMHDLYSQSSFGWDPPSKKEELFNPLSRFILALDRSTTDDQLIGFVMFRFEYEERKNLLYCYDFQIAKTSQQTGLGKKFMLSLTNIGKTWRMEKIVLTVFKSNERAFTFYKLNGFILDPTSPGYIEEDGTLGEASVTDYEILSKALNS